MIYFCSSSLSKITAKADYYSYYILYYKDEGLDVENNYTIKKISYIISIISEQ